MFSFFKRKTNKSEPIDFENNEEKSVLRLEHDGETDGKGNLSLLKEFTKYSNFPIFKGKVDNAYESDFLGYKDKCPLCNTRTVQQYSNFVWANQIAARLMAAPAGHFCPNCSTVIIDDDLMKAGVNTARFEYCGTCAIETGFESKKGDANLFKTLNGKKATYILNEQGGLGGILNSVHEPSDQAYMVHNQDSFAPFYDPAKSVQAKKKKESNKKKNKQAKQSRKANRKK